jgi:putative membrane protein
MTEQLKTTLGRRWPARPATLSVLAAVLGGLTLAACNRQESAPAQMPSTNTGTTAQTAPAPPPAPPSAPQQLSALDQAFVQAALASDSFEIEASQMALDRSKNAEVQAFARRMVNEHSEARSRLQTMIGQPAAVAEPAAHQREIARRLGGLSGQEFDREYVAQVGTIAHTEAVALFERAAAQASDTQIRAYAEQTLPALRGRLEEAQKLAQQVGARAEQKGSAKGAAK